MTFEEYQKRAMLTKQQGRTLEQDLANAGLGLTGESGEVADIIKKHLSGTKAIIEQNLKLEIGDILWYVAALCDTMNFEMSDIAELNIEKLRKRHGNAFSGYGNRDDEFK